MDSTSAVAEKDRRIITYSSFLEVSAAFMSVFLNTRWAKCCTGIVLQCRCHPELTAVLLNRRRWSIFLEIARQNTAEHEKRHKAVAMAVQMSLLFMNYTKAHFSSNEILNGVMRTSSPLCITEPYKIMDLNGNSLPALMKHDKHSQFTQKEGERQKGVKW